MRTMKTKPTPKARVEVATHPLEVIVTVGDRQLGAQITPTTARRMAKALLELAETEPRTVGKGAGAIAFRSDDLGALLKHMLSERRTARRAPVDAKSSALPADVRKLRTEIERIRRQIDANGVELAKLIAASPISRGTRH